MTNKDKPSFSVPEFPKRMLIGLQDGYCNLKCPMCYVHGSDDDSVVKALRGVMSFEDACRIFDEVMGAKPAISPIIWSEPLLIKDFRRFITAIKSRGMAIVLNTNGLLLTDDLAKFIVDIEINSIFFSIDAMTSDTLKRKRGIEGLDKINNAVFRMIKARGERPYPRIGTSFVISEENVHEKEEFIKYWRQHADAVRVNDEYEVDRSIKNAKIPKERIPCGVLYDTMVINHKGDVPICCLDSFNTMIIGNVFESGVKEVWHSERLQEIRYYHETGQYDKVPFCKSCDAWSASLTEEEIVDGILVRRSPVITYYNRIDRMDTWKGGKKPISVTTY